MQESFIHHVFHQFRRHCMEKEVAANTANFLDFMLSRHLINESTIRHFVLLEEYQEMEHSRRYKNKTEAVKQIARVHGVHENTVWNVLKDHKGKFEVMSE